MNRSIPHRKGFCPLVCFKLQGAGQARRSPNLCILSEIHSRSLRQRLKNWSETLREDRNGKNTGTDAKAACARKGNDRPPRPGRVQAEAMFFANPTAAFRNIGGALKPGGRLTFACWAPLEENRHWLISYDIALRHLGPPAPQPANVPSPLARRITL